MTGIAPRVEDVPAREAEEAFGKMMENKVRFRAVLVP